MQNPGQKSVVLANGWLAALGIATADKVARLGANQQQEQAPVHGLHLLDSATLLLPLLALQKSLWCCSFCSGFPVLAQLAPAEARHLASANSCLEEHSHC